MCKIIRYTLLITIATLSFVGCEIDDMPRPNSTLYGSVISIRNYGEDNESYEPFEAYIGSKTAYVRLYESNPDYATTTSESMTIMEDGSFRQSMMPSTSYSVDTYQCPHLLLNGSEVVTLPQNGSCEHTLYCIPYLFIDLWQEGNELVFVITKPDQVPYTGELDDIQLIYSTLPKVNTSVGSVETETLYNYSTGNNSKQSSVLGNEYRVNMKEAFPSITDGMYYFRATAEISDADTDEENYSNIIYAEYNSELDNENNE